MMTRLTILWKGMILIAVPLLFQLGFINLVSWMRSEANLAEFWTMHTKDVIILSEDCRAELLSAHGSIQGYILTHDSTFDTNLRRYDELTRDKMIRLSKLVTDNPYQQQAAKVLELKAGLFLEYMKEGARLVRTEQLEPSAAASRRQGGERYVTELSHGFQMFVAEELRLQAIRDTRLKRTSRRLDTLLWWGSVVSVISTVIIAILFAKNISGRINILTDNAIRVASNKELNAPIGGGDEISRLDEVFHHMARTLAEATRRERTHSDLLEQRAEELAIVNGQLHEKATENEMFVYSVSHDLRSPLVNLQGFSKELSLIGKDLNLLLNQEGVPPETRKKSRDLIENEMAESIKFIQTAVTRLSSIIDALLRLSRAGRVEYRRSQVNVEPIVTRIVTALRGTIEQRGATVTVGTLPTVYCDATALEQIFANLIGNAVNYLDSNRHGLINVFAVDEPLSQDRKRPTSVIYAVADNGLGISDSYKGKIFTAFQRLHGDIAKGEGVGLALVRRVVERLGGKIWFESKVGVGTTFYVSLPAFDPETTRVEEKSVGTMELSRTN